ncbi:EamA family transporter [Acidipila sp. EB88]|nr:EamA family transporter [Acidipila sp. EB88]
MTTQRYLVLLIVAVTAPLGDTLLAVGMKQIGPVSLEHPALLLHAILNPSVAAGIALLIGFFASYTAALSWADLTFVLPTTSIGNVLIALLSRFWLHEHISASRWLGIALITMGVGFVANGSSYTEHAEPAAQPAFSGRTAGDL